MGLITGPHRAGSAFQTTKYRLLPLLVLFLMGGPPVLAQDSVAAPLICMFS
jgi:hypothetical protein